MRRRPSAVRPLLISALSVGLLASCNENKPASSTTASSGTVKLIPSNMAGGGDAAGTAGSSSGTANADGSVTRVYNPNERFTGTSTPSRIGGPATPPAPATPAPAPVSNADLPDAPVGAQWTLYCQTIQGPGHVERSNDVKQQLIKSTGLKSWYVIHAADASNLYYGFYRSIDAADRTEKDGQRAQADRKRIDGMKDAQGERPFARCMFVELSAPDPEAPLEWDLRNAKPDMYWSVQIAAYQQHPDRKRFAVEAVKEARKRGIEAYYYHGPSVSSVCVGSWPLTAVRYDLARGQAGDPTRDLVVLPEGLPPIQGNLRDAQGKRLTVATKEVEIVDPTLIATLQKYPTHAINGAERMIKGKNKMGQTTERPEPSFMVRIPDRYVQGENAGDPVNADRPVVDDPGFNYLRPRNQSKYDYIPKK